MATIKNTTMARVVAGIALAGLLAGCASGQQTAGPPTSDSHTARPNSSSQRTVAPHDKLTPKAVPLDVSPTAPAGFVSAAWSMRPVAHPAATKRVYLVVDVPVCSGGQMAYTLTTTSRSIEVGYWVRPRPKHIACSAVRVTTDGYLELPSAVGGRTITHVPVGLHAPA